MNCPRCQNVIPSSTIFCAYCGARVLPTQIPARSRSRRNGIILGIALIILLVGAGNWLFGSFVQEEEVTAAVPVVIPDPSPTPTAVPEESRPAPTPQATFTPMPTATPTLTASPTPNPTPTAVPRPTNTSTPMPTATPTPLPIPTPTPRPTATSTVIPRGIELSPSTGHPYTEVSIYGRGVQANVQVDLVYIQLGIGYIDVTPSPKPFTDSNGKLYLNFSVPRLVGGLYTVVVRIGNVETQTIFQVIALPTPTPTITPVPVPTRVSKVLRHARHAGAHYTVNVPSNWSGGHVTFFGRNYEGPPGPWVQANTIRGATRYDITALKEAGVNLVGTYFKERYSSDELCGTKGYVVIRETALLTNYPSTGIALHVDVCEEDLHIEAELGFTNEDISNEIIRSLQNHS